MGWSFGTFCEVFRRNVLSFSGQNEGSEKVKQILSSGLVPELVNQQPVELGLDVGLVKEVVLHEVQAELPGAPDDRLLLEQPPDVVGDKKLGFILMRELEKNPCQIFSDSFILHHLLDDHTGNSIGKSVGFVFLNQK